MNNLNDNLESFVQRSGLYCVWVPLHDDGQAPLIAVWIDPSMTVFEPPVHEEPLLSSP